MRISLIIFPLFIVNQCLAGGLLDPENQDYYDPYLGGLLEELNQVEVKGQGSQCDSDLKIDILSGLCAEYDGGAYAYRVLNVCASGIKIKADNKAGGRSYLYDSEWNVVSYVFSNTEEERNVGRRILQWVTENHLSEAEEVRLLEELGWRGLLTDQGMMFAKYDVLGCVGGFLIYEDLRKELWKVVDGGEVYMDDRGREICVRSILSNFENYSEDLKKEVTANISAYVDRCMREEEFRTEDVAEFVRKRKKGQPVNCSVSAD